MFETQGHQRVHIGTETGFCNSMISWSGFHHVLSLGLHACPVSHWIDLFTQMKSSIGQKAGSAGCRKVCSSTVKTDPKDGRVVFVRSLKRGGPLLGSFAFLRSHTIRNAAQLGHEDWNLLWCLTVHVDRWKSGCTWIYIHESTEACVLLIQYLSSIKVTKLHHLLLDPLLTECSKRQSMEVDEV